jgi:hypothetical protein
MAKVGRKPRKVTKEQLEMVRDFAEKGMYDKNIMAYFGWGKDWFYQQKRENPEFAEAIDGGREGGIKKIADKLWEAAEAGNITAITYFLARRGGWTETQQHQMLDENGDRAKWQVTFVNSDMAEKK